LIEEINTTKASIDSLNREVEVWQRVYSYFCNNIVKRLLEQFDDGYMHGLDVGSIVNSRCFRATHWEWRPLHKLIFELCSDLFGKEEVKEICQTGRHRLEDAAKCREMAVRFRKWLGQNEGGYSLDRAADEDREWRVERERLLEWINFLEECGGYRPTLERIKSSLDN
jgi:hypothetical protein